MQSHEEYVNRWRAQYQEETGCDELGAELAYESYAGMTDCHCEECSAWHEASGYVKAALDEPYEHHNKLHWEFVNAVMWLCGKKDLN
jgi:hypothetical protein